MRKIHKNDYCELAVFLMDYHSGQWSKGYRILSKLQINNFSPSFCAECRKSDIYDYLVLHYSKTV